MRRQGMRSALVLAIAAGCTSCGNGGSADNSAADSQGGASAPAGGSASGGTLSPSVGGTNSTAAGSPSTGPENCMLVEDPQNPTLSIKGTACGEVLDFTTTAGLVIDLGRSSLFDPIEEVTVIEFRDDPSNFSANLPEYYDEFAILFNLGLSTGFLVTEATSEHVLSSSLVAVCGLGMLIFEPGPVKITISQLDSAGGRAGSLRLELSGLKVSGYSNEYGSSEATVCDGSVDVVLDGAFSHEPG